MAIHIFKTINFYSTHCPARLRLNISRLPLSQELIKEASTVFLFQEAGGTSSDRAGRGHGRAHPEMTLLLEELTLSSYGEHLPHGALAWLSYGYHSPWTPMPWPTRAKGPEAEIITDCSIMCYVLVSWGWSGRPFRGCGRSE